MVHNYNGFKIFQCTFNMVVYRSFLKYDQEQECKSQKYLSNCQHAAMHGIWTQYKCFKWDQGQYVQIHTEAI